MSLKKTGSLVAPFFIFGVGVAFADSSVYQLPVIPVSPVLSPGLSIQGDTETVYPAIYQSEGINNLSDLLRDALGVQIKSGDTSNPVIYLRGKPALVMVNGVPINNFSMEADDLNSISYSQIERVEVTQSADGGMDGDQSTGGVVNIITRQPSQASDSISFMLGNPWQTQVSADLNQGWENGWLAGLDLGGDYNSGYQDHSESSQQNVSTTIGRQYAGGEVITGFWMANQNIDYPGGLTAAELSPPTQSIVSEQSEFSTLTSGANLNWKQDLANLWQWNLLSSYRHQNGNATFEDPDIGNFSQSYNSANLEPELQGNTPLLNRTLHSTLGFDFNYDSYHQTYDPENAYRNQYATFYRASLPLLTNLLFTATDRMAYIQTHSDEIDLSDQSNYTTLNDLSLKLSKPISHHWDSYIERLEGYALPFIDEQTDSGNGQAITGFALNPTTSTTYQAGLTARYQKITGAFSIYQINDENEIGYLCQSSLQCANINLPDTRERGVTLSETWQIVQQASWQNTVDMAEHVFTQAASGVDLNAEVPGASAFTWSSLLRYQFFPRWVWSVNSQYEDAYYADGDYQNVGPKIPSYIIFNTALSFRPKPWLISLALNNITNQLYYADTSFVSPVVYYYPADGREVLVTVTYDF